MSHLPDDSLRSLAEAVARTHGHEISCDELIERLAAYVESGASTDPGRPVPPELQAVREHLAICPECSEELAALLRAIDTLNP